MDVVEAIRTTGRCMIQILLIEDNYDEAELIDAMLKSVRRFAFRLFHVNTLAQGIEQLHQAHDGGEPIDVVLLDLRLPDSSGFDTFERAHQQAPWTPIILMTCLDNEELALQAVRKGAQDYLVKSELNGHLLTRTIRYAIERKRIEEALRESEERYTLAIQGANDGIWDWDLRTNRVYYSPRWKYMLGYEETEIGDQSDEWLERVHPEDIENVITALSAHIKGVSAHFESQHRMQRKDGAYIWTKVRGLAVRDKQGGAYRMAGSQSDITLQKNTEEQLLYDAFHDTLTGLPNRALFLDRLERAVEHVKRYPDYRFGVLFLDLDRFKVVNDSLGHTFGDQLLIDIAKKIGSCLRGDDSVARIGGDEFVILLAQLSHISDALAISERIQHSLQSPIELGNQTVVITASIGIVMSDLNYDTPEDVLRDADIAMYHAKMLGKACHAIFEPSMRKRVILRMGLESDLRQVLESEKRIQDDFKVVYQPILSLPTGKIVGFEALLRWFHPERGLIMPKEFIPIAEETGLIHLLGLWVLREACKQVSIWQAQNHGTENVPPVSVNVNISGKQLDRLELVNYIEGIIREFAIPPSSLNLEITESLLLESKEPICSELQRIRNLGVNLQVDDFGEGYSSFRYLQNLPVNSLKIDSAYIQRLGTGGSNSEIVRSIVGLAKSLGMSVIAEGVETESQIQLLKELGCPFVQGFYFSEPVSGEKAGELLLWNRKACERQQ
ncbi:MAG: EAL domain-containing protein [Anaerolineales bacterium]|nr:EAL domain-containing protein [Anaerolineales bacterium]